ncbi:hypothetical protein UlMin_012346 [Ulmus minor]
MIRNIEVKMNKVQKFDELDPREPAMEQHKEPMEKLVEIPLVEDDPFKTYKIGSSLTGQLCTDLINFLRDNRNVFTCFRHVKQRRRTFNAKRYMAINTEVDKLLKADLIQEANYPDWITNVVLIKKVNSKWRLSSVLYFHFKATNNQAKYEALLAGLRLAKEVSARYLLIYSDSQLIVNQVNSEYQAKGEKMTFYLEKAKELLGKFEIVTITQIPRNENSNADALAHLTMRLEDCLLKIVPLEILDEPSINKHQQVDTISDKLT